MNPLTSFRQYSVVSPTRSTGPVSIRGYRSRHRKVRELEAASEGSEHRGCCTLWENEPAIEKGVH